MLKNTWKPKNYQITAFNFLIKNKNAGLFLDAGLGKTSTILLVIRMLIYARSIKGVLIIAPLRIMYSTFPNEIEKWDNFKNLTYTILHGKTKADLWKKKTHIYITNPESLSWLYNELSEKLHDQQYDLPFDMLVVDESTRFKNPKQTIKKSKNLTRFGYLKQLLPLFKRKVIMTGTPAAKSYIDLWSQIYILDQGESLNKNFYRFRKQYFYTESWNEYNWLLKAGSEKKIQRAIANIVLDMSAEKYIDIPPILYNEILVDLPDKAMKVYKQMENKLFAELDENESITADAAAQSVLKCHQIVSGAIYEDIPPDLNKEQLLKFKRNRKTIKIHDQKIEALQDLIESLNGKPLLVAYQYKHELERIQKLLGENTPYIGSGVSAENGKLIQNEWNKGNIQILLGHPASMGHGLNLQESGNDICWFSIPHDLELYIQFNKRIHRQGVKNKVRIHHLIANNTIDIAIMERLAEKAEQQIDLRKALTKYRLKDDQRKKQATE